MTPDETPGNRRIASLLASATEILCELGLRDRLVGRSHECDHPPSVLDLPVLSASKVDPTAHGSAIDRDVRQIVADGLSVYRVLVDDLERVRPDLIITQDHCEVCAVSLSDVTDALWAANLPDTAVCTLHPQTLGDVRRDFLRVADAAGVPLRGHAMVQRFDARLAEIERTVGRSATRPRVALLEWLSPPMIAGGWMPELARIAGGVPLIVPEPTTFETVDWGRIVDAEPDVVVVLPCGYGIDTSLEEMRDSEIRASLDRLHQCARVFVADGNAFFNRPGPRLVDSAEILAAILHPEVASPYAERHQSAYQQWVPMCQSVNGAAP